MAAGSANLKIGEAGVQRPVRRADLDFTVKDKASFQPFGCVDKRDGLSAIESRSFQKRRYRRRVKQGVIIGDNAQAVRKAGEQGARVARPASEYMIWRNHACFRETRNPTRVHGLDGGRLKIRHLKWRTDIIASTERFRMSGKDGIINSSASRSIVDQAAGYPQCLQIGGTVLRSGEKGMAHCAIDRPLEQPLFLRPWPSPVVGGIRHFCHELINMPLPAVMIIRKMGAARPRHRHVNVANAIRASHEAAK
ncbi:hypothetical protein AOA14_13360 [Sphingopyxis terrae subsp. terrae NBRC 15098]|uniref:Uncharacterized protein n=1 Tax=Sphingopyxis terrae subsp. terrae NBRC 15098 TaxID=1219058 RepID=A0A142W0K6_9SPHN|nr:hypothetical protein AOA14_13360 [Sphingopyxis terrae subsp. terrae NBRC 15098]